MNALKLRYFLFLLGLFGIVVACDDDNDFSTASVVGFGTTWGEASESLGVEGKAIPFYSNVTLTAPVTFKVALRNSGAVAYGTDYTTQPAAVDGVITVTVQPDETPSFMVYPIKLDASPQVRKVVFEILSVEGGDVSLTETNSRYYELWITRDARLVIRKFEDCQGTPVGFAEARTASASAVATWGCTNFGYDPTDPVNKNTKGAEANAFNKGGVGSTNAYLISNRIDAGEFTSLEVAMQTYSHFSGNGTLAVVYSTNYSGSGDPDATGVTWTPLPNNTATPATITEALPAAGSKKWTGLTGVIKNTANKSYYIAFQYKGATSASASSWRIDDFIVTGLE